MSLCKNLGFILYLVSNFLFTTGYFIPTGLLPETAVSRGIYLDELSLTFAFSGLTQVAGRLVFGFISHIFSSQITRLQCAFLIATGLSMIIVPFSDALYHFMIFNFLSGFFQVILKQLTIHHLFCGQVVQLNVTCNILHDGLMPNNNSKFITTPMQQCRFGPRSFNVTFSCSVKVSFTMETIVDLLYIIDKLYLVELYRVHLTTNGDNTYIFSGVTHLFYRQM